MITIAMLHEVVTGIDEQELEDWIARRWVRPEEGDQGYGFEDIDVARIRLIQTLRHEWQTDAQTLPIILSLLDQLHQTRRQLNELRQVMQTP